MSNEETTHLRFAPDILRRLGEELISSPYLGIMELVRNSYDADACQCRIELDATEEVGGTLRVSDDGIGMNEQTIRSGWLVLGSSGKKVDAQRIRTKAGRLPIGDKGLGRLAALRMGSKAILRTRPVSEPNTEYSIIFDWTRYDSAPTIDDVNLEIEKAFTEKPNGTDIEISNLHTKLTKRDAQQLARSLVLMADPFGTESSFHPALIVPEYKELEQLVQTSYFSQAEYRLVATLDENGRASAQVFDWNGKLLFEAGHETLRESKKNKSKKIEAITVRPYDSPPATFELWVFPLVGTRFANRASGATLKEVKEWLGVAGGIHLYQRDVRVHPYGDPGYDWLEMNVLRAKMGEETPSTNNSVGRVVVHDPDEVLISKTDRTGFIENEAFVQLKNFAIDALNWMVRTRIRAANDSRITERTKAPEDREEAEQAVSQALEVVPPELRKSVTAALERLQKANQREVQLLREDLQLYRTLATVGTTAAVFAHEAGGLINSIEKNASTIERRGRKELGLLYSSTLEGPIAILTSTARSLRAYASVPIHLLKKNKRTQGKVLFHQAIQEVYGWFQPFFEEYKISCKLELCADHTSMVLGSPAALEAVIANLVTNSINAFLQSTLNRERQIVIRTQIVRDNLLLCVMDSGPGIVKLDINDIWLPGKTTTQGGTGLGLTIVRDIVSDLRGYVSAVAHGTLGGAEFTVQFPLTEANQ